MISQRVAFRIALIWVAPFTGGLIAQTTQGLISGRVREDLRGVPVRGATVTCENRAANASYRAITNSLGDYVLPLLPPGVYDIKVNAGPRYRAAEVDQVELPVAGFLRQDFSLRLLTDIWQTGKAYSASPRGGNMTVLFYGPDVDITRSVSVERAEAVRGSLEPSMSYVIDASLIRNLPLAGRDVYAALVLLPGVTNDTSTIRGLGSSANGQRPSSSNYILDGVENNHYLVSGPLTVIAPEAVQEYRISINNFSAEYGRTAGFLANAVTRSGSSNWHGIGYHYFKAQALNANDFQRNAQPHQPRLPMHEYQGGFQTGGPLERGTWFSSTSLEHLWSRSSGDGVQLTVPTARGIAALAPASFLSVLLSRFHPPAAPEDLAIEQTFRPAVTISRTTALQRIDGLFARERRIFARLSVFRSSRPDFIWSPYPDFTSGLDHDATAIALGTVRSWSTTHTVELRASVGSDREGWNRAHPEIPLLKTPLGDIGSPARYTLDGRGKTAEAAGNLVRVQTRHVIKTGAGLLMRWYSDRLSLPGAQYQLTFDTLEHLNAGVPSAVQLPISRPDTLTGPFLLRDDARRYRYGQFFAFAQDSFRMSPRLILHFGVRYDYLGPPKNVGNVPDRQLRLGGEASFPERIAALPLPRAGESRVFDVDARSWAPRAGFAWNLDRSGNTILRGSYGIFYDRLFDNLWLNAQLNDAVRATVRTSAANPLPAFDISKPLTDIFPLFQSRISPDLFNSVNLTLFQPHLRAPYVQSHFLGLQKRFAERWSAEASYAGALGRELLTTDVVNRIGSIPGGTPCPRLTCSLPDINYLANQGSSGYHALALSAYYRMPRAQFRVSYTWSHAIDNQSDPLQGFATNLGVVTPTGRPVPLRPAAFTVQFDSHMDRASADFDQRHNLVSYAVWELPSFSSGRWLRALSKNWRMAQAGALRSGSPFTVYAQFQGGALRNNRANLVDPSILHASLKAIPGGRSVLNEDAFRDPGVNLGNLGRNAFFGPGVFNLDLSLSRSFALPGGHESRRLILRADAYNFLNHANLNNPDPSTTLCCPDYGGALTFASAYRGRQGRTSGLPVLTPFNETARQVQLMLRVEF